MPGRPSSRSGPTSPRCRRHPSGYSATCKHGRPSPQPRLKRVPPAPNPAWCRLLLLLPSNPGALAAAPAGCQNRPLALPSRVLRVPSLHLVVACPQPEQTPPPPTPLLLGSGKTSQAPLAAAAMTPAFLFCAPSPLSWTQNIPPTRPPPAIRNGPSLRFLQVLERALISVSFPGPGGTPPCLCPERVPIPLPETGPIRVWPTWRAYPCPVPTRVR